MRHPTPLFICACVLSLLISAMGHVALATPLKICVVEENAPFTYKDKNGQWAGLDIDIWRALQASEESTFIPVTFQDALTSLENKLCDMLLSNVTITPERLERVLFSTPYLESGLYAMVHEQDYAALKNASLDGKTIVVIAYTTADIFASFHYKNATILALSSEKDAFKAFASKKAQIMIHDRPGLDKYIHDVGKAVLLDQPLAPQNYAYAFPLDGEELRRTVNAALAHIRKEGILKKIYHQWFIAKKNK